MNDDPKVVRLVDARKKASDERDKAEKLSAAKMQSAFEDACRHIAEDGPPRAFVVLALHSDKDDTVNVAVSVDDRGSRGLWSRLLGELGTVVAEIRDNVMKVPYQEVHATPPISGQDKDETDDS